MALLGLTGRLPGRQFRYLTPTVLATVVSVAVSLLCVRVWFNFMGFRAGSDVDGGVLAGVRGSTQFGVARKAEYTAFVMTSDAAVFRTKGGNFIKLGSKESGMSAQASSGAFPKENVAIFDAGGRNTSTPHSLPLIQIDKEHSVPYRSWPNSTSSLQTPGCSTPIGLDLRFAASAPTGSSLRRVFPAALTDADLVKDPPSSCEFEGVLDRENQGPTGERSLRCLPRKRTSDLQGHPKNATAPEIPQNFKRDHQDQIVLPQASELTSATLESAPCLVFRRVTNRVPIPLLRIPYTCTHDKVWRKQVVGNGAVGPIPERTGEVTGEIYMLPEGCMQPSVRGARKTSPSNIAQCTGGPSCSALFDAKHFYVSGMTAAPTYAPGTKPVELKDGAVSLQANWYGSWQHFILDALPKLALMLPYLRVHRNAKVLVPMKPSKFQAFFFRLLNVHDRIVVFRKGQVFCGKNMAMYLRRPPPNSVSVTHLRKTCEGNMALKDALLAALPPPRLPLQILYISRAGRSRTPQNEKAVLAMIRERMRVNRRSEELTIVVGHKLSPREQLEIHSRAAFIIGSHGGGHVASITAPVGAVTIQFGVRSPNPRHMSYGGAYCTGMMYFVGTDKKWHVPMDDLKLTLDLAFQHSVDPKVCVSAVFGNK